MRPTDGKDSCPIASAAMCFDLKDPEYPAAIWVYADDGKPTCLSFEAELSEAERDRRAAIAAGQTDLFA